MEVTGVVEWYDAIRIFDFDDLVERLASRRGVGMPPFRPVRFDRAVADRTWFFDASYGTVPQFEVWATMWLWCMVSYF